MVEIFNNLYVGNETDCSFNTFDKMAIIHACKFPCHAKAVGYRGSLSPTHPNYLIMEQGLHLFLNMVDMERELSPLYTNPIMKSAMAFIEKHIVGQKILIHCNQGLSRSPSIALLYLAHEGHIANDSYSNAVNDFRKLFPVFNPGLGIALYMKNRWKEIIKL
jgi:hypothetical protein